MSRTQLKQAVANFGQDLQNFYDKISNASRALKRSNDGRQVAGVHEFKEVLQDVEEKVAELTQGIKQLEHCTVDTISLEELLGHCHEVYQSNRQGIVALERHLQQYGYSSDAAPEVEPEDPFPADALNSDDETDHQEEALRMASLLESGLPDAIVATPSSAQRSPVSVRRIRPTTLSAPSSPRVERLQDISEDVLLRGSSLQTTLSASVPTVPAPAAIPAATRAKQAAMAAAKSNIKPSLPARVSLDSRASDSPDILLLSPSFAEMQRKYASSSAGVSAMLDISKPLSDASSELPSLPSASTNLDKPSPRRELSFDHLQLGQQYRSSKTPAATPGAALRASLQQRNNRAAPAAASPLGRTAGPLTQRAKTAPRHRLEQAAEQPAIAAAVPQLAVTASMDAVVTPRRRPPTPGKELNTPDWHQQALLTLNDLHTHWDTVKHTPGRRTPGRARSKSAPRASPAASALDFTTFGFNISRANLDQIPTPTGSPSVELAAVPRLPTPANATSKLAANGASRPAAFRDIEDDVRFKPAANSRKAVPGRVEYQYACELRPEEYQKLPGYLRSQVTLEMVNGAVKDINEIVARRALETRPGDPVTFGLGDLGAKGFDLKQARAVTQVLTNVKQAYMITQGGQTVYSLA